MRELMEEIEDRAIEPGPLVFFLTDLNPTRSLILISGKKAFIAGVADDGGFGWAIAKALAEAGCEISLGVWVSFRDFFFFRPIEATKRSERATSSLIFSNSSSFSFSSLFSLSQQVPALNIFESSLKRGKFDANRKLSDGSMMEFAHILPMDAGENF